MSFTSFFQENRDEIQHAILVLRDLESDDKANSPLYAAAKNFLAAIMQKSVWLVGFEDYRDGAAFKNAVFACGYIGAQATQYHAVSENFDVNNIPLFSSKIPLLNACRDELSAFGDILMSTSVAVIAGD